MSEYSPEAIQELKAELSLIVLEAYRQWVELSFAASVGETTEEPQ